MISMCILLLLSMDRGGFYDFVLYERYQGPMAFDITDRQHQMTANLVEMGKMAEGNF